MKTLQIYAILAFVLFAAACKKDSPQLPSSQLILGQWKWISFALKVVDSDGATTNVVSQSFPPEAYIKFESPDIFYDSEDGINVEQSKWTLDDVNHKLTLADTEYNILRLDSEYLIISYDAVDPSTQDIFRYSFVFKR